MCSELRGKGALLAPLVILSAAKDLTERSRLDARACAHVLRLR